MGWEPEIIWHTPVPQIFLALEGKYDFVIKTNPFGAKQEKPLSEDKKSQNLVKNKARAAKFDMMMLAARKKNGQRDSRTTADTN